MKKIITLLLAVLLAMLALASAEAEPANWGGDKASSDVRFPFPPVFPNPQSCSSRSRALLNVYSQQWGKGACMKRAPNVQKAIEGYCNFGNNQGFMVPGYHANQGKKVGNAFVQIGYGGCKNAQWVPWVSLSWSHRTHVEGVMAFGEQAKLTFLSLQSNRTSASSSSTACACPATGAARTTACTARRSARSGRLPTQGRGRSLAEMGSLLAVS